MWFEECEEGGRREEDDGREFGDGEEAPLRYICTGWDFAPPTTSPTATTATAAATRRHYAIRGVLTTVYEQKLGWEWLKQPGA